MNFARDVVAAQPSMARALIELTQDGDRREWTFGEVAASSGALAARITEMGIGRGDVVMTLIGNRSEWVLAMVACFRLGAVVLPCNEQLRAKDLALRFRVAAPRLILADERNRAELEAAGPTCPVLSVPDESLLSGRAVPYVELGAEDPCLLTFTSGTEGDPKAVVHLQRYLAGQAVQAEHWLDVQGGDVVWCTAASGWSKSARNAFIAPWIRGATALIHDGRFDVAQRLEILRTEGVSLLCMAPTEYRIVAKRAEIPRFPDLRGLVAAGEALNPEVLALWADATGLLIRDGYGQTETGQLTGTPLDESVRPGSMGKPLPGMKLWIDDGELVVDPTTVPTFFHGYLGNPPVDRRSVWRTGDLVREEDGWLFFEGRSDDVIVSSGYRIGPFEVESALIAHPQVAEAAVIAAADPERGEIVRALIVLTPGVQESSALAGELQEHVKRTTAPYKYPRRLDFVTELPKTTSGKIQRAKLRAMPAGELGMLLPPGPGADNS